MSDSQEFEFHMREPERPDRYMRITNHLRKASIANLRHDEDAEREELEIAHDLLSEVMGR